MRTKVEDERKERGMKDEKNEHDNGNYLYLTDACWHDV